MTGPATRRPLLVFLYDQDESRFLEPVGYLLLSALAKREGFQTRFLDDHDHRRLSDQLREAAPFAVCATAYTGGESRIAQLMSVVKQATPGAVTIVGGSHPTFHPGYLEASLSIDILMRGEADDVFPLLLQRLLARTSFVDLTNISFRDHGAVIHRPLGLLKTDLDTLPYLDRTVSPIIRDKPLKCFVTNRGCLFRCTYCFEESLAKLVEGKGPFLRRQSIDRILDEVVYVKRHFPLQFVMFHDDVFCYDAAWTEEFCTKYRRRVKLPFSINQRADLVVPRMVMALQRGGCVSVTMGYETGNDRIRKDLLGRPMSKDTMIRATRLFREANIFITAQNMLGLPTETMADALETLDLNITAKPSYSWVSVFYPYPNTTLGDYAQREGLVDSSKTYESYHHGTVMKCDDKEALMNLQRLFAIVVRYPWLRPHVPRLISWRLGRVYELARLLFKGWLYKRERYRTIKFTPTDLWQELVTYVKLRHN